MLRLKKHRDKTTPRQMQKIYRSVLFLVSHAPYGAGGRFDIVFSVRCLEEVHTKRVLVHMQNVYTVKSAAGGIVVVSAPAVVVPPATADACAL